MVSGIAAGLPVTAVRFLSNYTADISRNNILLATCKGTVPSLAIVLKLTILQPVIFSSCFAIATVQKWPLKFNSVWADTL